MPTTWRGAFRLVIVPLCTLSAISAGGCGGSSSSGHESPTAPTPTGDPRFQGSSTVGSVSGVSPCGDTLRAGDVYTDMRWDVVEASSANGPFAIAYDDVWVNGPDSPRYSGTLNGLHFADDFRVEGDYLAKNCTFRESSISGEFSLDFRSFEAREIQIFGPPSMEYRVEMVHRAARP